MSTGNAGTPPAHHHMWSYEDNSQLKINRSVDFFMNRLVYNEHADDLRLPPTSHL